MNNIKNLRVAAGLSQPELARLCQKADRRIDVGMISRFECGACLPTPGVAKALATALRCTVTDLYDFPEQMYVPGILAADAPVEPESMAVTSLVAYLTEAGGPIKRSELADLMGGSDRYMRQAVEDARNCGYIIINNGKGDGYYIASTVDEIEQHFRTEENRALSILHRLKNCRRILKAEGRI